MKKLIHSHKDYYEYKHQGEFYKIKRKSKGVLLLMNDDYNKCIICDKKLNILHEIVISSGGAFPLMGIVT